MTQNIEQRTEVAVTKYENAANKVEEFAESDGLIVTTSGSRKSFPKLSREIEEAGRESLRLGAANHQGNYASGVTFDKSNWTYTYNGQQWGLSRDFDLSTLPYEATFADPNDDGNLAVRGDASEDYVNNAVHKGQEALIDGSIYKGSNGEYVLDGDTVPEGATHLSVLVDSEVTIVEMHPKSSGVVSLITDSNAAIGSTTVSFIAPIKRRKNYTLLSEGATKISHQAKTFLGKQVLITGDSLSFNGFGYPAGWNVVGSGYATEQPLGISPWSAILRDSLISSNNFQSIKDLKVVTNCDTAPPTTSERAYHGMNSVALVFTPDGGVYDGTDSTTLVTNYAGGQALLIGTRPQGTGASFDLNGETISTDSDDNHHQGYGYKIVPFTPISGEFCNIENIQGSSLVVYGIVPSEIKITKITGKGGWTSTQIFDEYDDLIDPYNPDVILYIIGANDADTGDPVSSGYNDSVQAFIDRAKSDNPNVEIILISMPPTSSYSTDVITQFLSAGYNLALKNGCSHVDLYNELLNYPTSDWRYDNIHCNTNGDTIWFNIFKNILFQGLDVQGIYQPVRECFLFTNLRDYLEVDTISCSVQLTNTKPTLVTSNGLEYNSKIKLEYDVVNGVQSCKVTLPKKYTLSSVNGLVVSANQMNIVRMGLMIDDNTFSVVGVGVDSNTVIDPDGSNLYFLFTATTDFK